jgi:hypothetical protein
MNVNINESGSDLHPTYCIRCGDVLSRKVAFSKTTLIVQCPKCNALIYGAEINPKCGCGESLIDVPGRLIAPEERVPGMEVCGKCKHVSAGENEVVSSGGAFFKCFECGRHGVMVAESGLKFRSMPGNEEYNKPVDGKYPSFGISFDKCMHHGDIVEGK